MYVALALCDHTFYLGNWYLHTVTNTFDEVQAFVSKTIEKILECSCLCDDDSPKRKKCEACETIDKVNAAVGIRNKLAAFRGELDKNTRFIIQRVDGAIVLHTNDVEALLSAIADRLPNGNRSSGCRNGCLLCKQGPHQCLCNDSNHCCESNDDFDVCCCDDECSAHYRG